jgi:tripartite-type tricarboxylate transporter receptor subunit TctC
MPMYARTLIRSVRPAALALAASLLALAPARADEPFYKGKTISLIIASNTSGGYDTYGRLLARHLPGHLAGNPTIVPQNMPGAGGIRAANYLYSVAPRDGTAFGIFDQAMFLDQLLGIPGLRGDVRQFNWIGRLMSNSSVLFAWHTAAVQKIQDAFTHELIVAAPGSNSRLNWTALNALAGTKLKLLTGYEGPATAKIAMERGEVEALSLPWGVLREENPQWLSEKKINLLLQTGLEKNAGLPDLPRMIDLAKNDEDRKVLEIFASPSLVGRSFAAPPGLPKERIDELRAAFVAMVKDPQFLAEVAKLNFDLDPLSGAELQDFFVRADYLPALVERARAVAKLAEH